MSSIKIQVRLFASLCKLSEKTKELTKEKKEFILNSQKVDSTTVLKEGDKVGLYPLIGGG